MRKLTTPGVYIREIEPPAPTRLRLDIASFVGQAEHGPLNYPQPVESWGQFRDLFGDFTESSYLPYSVFAFFANGGKRCYVTRIIDLKLAKKTQFALQAQKPDQNGDLVDFPIIQVTALNAGAWANSLVIKALDESTDDLVLTGLAQEIIAGVNYTVFESVAGLRDSATAGNALGDKIRLHHPQNPLRQEQLTIKQIDFENKTVTFEEPVNYDYPAGSSVLGKGFQLVFQYMKNSQLVRGELFDNLSMEPAHERYFKRVINGDPEEDDYIKKLEKNHSILARIDWWEDEITEPYRIKNQAEKLTPAEKGSDGDAACLTFPYYTGYENGAYFRPPTPPGVVRNSRENTEKLFGLAASEAVEEIGLVVIPDLIIADYYALLQANPIQIHKKGLIFTTFPESLLDLTNLKNGQLDMLYHCQKMGDRFAILDSPPGSEIGKGKHKIEDWPADFQLLVQSKNGALYYPWIKEKPADFEDRTLFIPPGGYIAGIFARTEGIRGVGKAPANEIVEGAVELEFEINERAQALLNPRSVNCIRTLPGRGIRVWGARTLSQDVLWRYVNVRRVCLAIIKNIVVNLRWTVFEPNDRKLWNKIASALRQFFLDLYHQGALAGNNPGEAFFIKCDDQTNPPEIIEKGQVITEIGFAPAKPAEFVLVTIKRTADSISVNEKI